MKIFITGISGLLGLNLALQLRDKHEISGCYHTHPVQLDSVNALQLDLLDIEHTNKLLHQLRPDVVIHTVGLTSVEGCESDPVLAHKLNVEATQHIAEASRTMKFKLVHISTDHLFDGASAWRREEDTPNPLNVYARTKLKAEETVLESSDDALVIRTNFYGWGTSVRSSFSDWIYQSLEKGQQLRMFSDVFFTPILINDLSNLILQLVNKGAAGIYNVAGRERLSKYDFAVKLADAFNCPSENIHSISVKEFPFKAQRPKDMSLCSEKAANFLGTQMPDIYEGLNRLNKLNSRGYPETVEQAIQSSRPRRASYT